MQQNIQNGEEKKLTRQNTIESSIIIRQFTTKRLVPVMQNRARTTDPPHWHTHTYKQQLTILRISEVVLYQQRK